ncbi:MAG: radical SAM protein [Deltaproteobacteria bacterium]|jgi:MoaA/NifB/PqqE/SkfB family radical SAM enzyme|nr:radical SAM protein [Deltaproteobacteria bacterium]
MGCDISMGTKFKLAVTTPIVRGLFKTLPYIPEDIVINTMKRFYGENSYPAGQLFIEKAFRTLKGVFKDANPNCKRAIINNMIINEGVKGQQKRNAVTKWVGFDIPLLLVVSPTQRCPLRCYGCYAAEHAKDSDLSFEAFDKLITEAKEMGIYFFVVSGGEPYIYDRIFEIFEKHSDAYFQTYTSGVTLAEKDHVEKIAKLGNVLPCISIEGFEEETDARRGEGHFKRIEESMAKLRDARVPFGFSGTCTRENNEKLLSDELIDYYSNLGCCAGYFFQYMPIGRSPIWDLVPTPEQRMYRYDRVNKLRAEKPILLADFWCDGPLVGGCLAAGRRYAHVNNKGDVEPCVFAQASDMNISEHTFMEILKESKLFKAIRRRQPYSENLLRPCMIIDVPECWREAIEESGAKLSYKTADNVAKELKDKIKDFSIQYKELCDPVWDRDYKVAYQKENDYVTSMRKYFKDPAVEIEA